MIIFLSVVWFTIGAIASFLEYKCCVWRKFTLKDFLFHFILLPLLGIISVGIVIELRGEEIVLWRYDDENTL
jgi:hypothetical protein